MIKFKEFSNLSESIQWHISNLVPLNENVYRVGSQKYSTRIWFSQLVQGTDDFGRCYQRNDPTSEYLGDLLATDGGFIEIQGTAEGETFSRAESSALLDLAEKGINDLVAIQKRVLGLV